ncbi:CLUMA_CG018644, isoform A [Clunio marinus]|uniref:CLUMA_CG018644, isoform A n=1 Tax=Clunio marinus TaxID=568069 RepID=A0A1J1IZF4_9DIPT|nr:CLUMA_CG018644, isoform A [Clunio marinus]
MLHDIIWLRTTKLKQDQNTEKKLGKKNFKCLKRLHPLREMKAWKLCMKTIKTKQNQTWNEIK